MTEPIAGYILPQQFYTLDVALCWCLSRLCSCYRTRDQGPKTNCSIWLTQIIWPSSIHVCIVQQLLPFCSIPFHSIPFHSVPLLSVVGFPASILTMLASPTSSLLQFAPSQFDRLALTKTQLCAEGLWPTKGPVVDRRYILLLLCSLLSKLFMGVLYPLIHPLYPFITFLKHWCWQVVETQIYTNVYKFSRCHHLHQYERQYH